MANLIKKGAEFKNFPCALDATDVMFQQGNHTSGTLLEGKLYFSGKQKLHGGYKTEVSVALTGQAINGKDHKPGSISDLVTFQHNRNFYN